MNTDFYSVLILATVSLWLFVRYAFSPRTRDAVGTYLFIAGVIAIVVGIFFGFPNVPAAISLALIAVGSWAKGWGSWLFHRK